jgi:hypothetical protein
MKMSDVEKIEAVLYAAAEVELNLFSKYARKILAEKIKKAIDNDDTYGIMKGQLTLNF